MSTVYGGGSWLYAAAGSIATSVLPTAVTTTAAAMGGAVASGAATVAAAATTGATAAAAAAASALPAAVTTAASTAGSAVVAGATAAGSAVASAPALAATGVAAVAVGANAGYAQRDINNRNIGINADIAINQGNHDLALEKLETLEKRGLSDKEAAQIAEKKLSIKIDQTMKSDPSKVIDFESEIHEALKKNPENPFWKSALLHCKEIRYNASAMHVEIMKVSETSNPSIQYREELEKFIADNPELQLPKQDLIQLHYQQGMLQEALSAVQTHFLSESPDNAFGLYMKGIISVGLGEITEGKRILEAQLEKYPEDKNIRFGLEKIREIELNQQQKQRSLLSSKRGVLYAETAQISLDIFEYFIENYCKIYNTQDIYGKKIIRIISSFIPLVLHYYSNEIKRLQSMQFLSIFEKTLSVSRYIILTDPVLKSINAMLELKIPRKLEDYYTWLNTYVLSAVRFTLPSIPLLIGAFSDPKENLSSLIFLPIEDLVKISPTRQKLLNINGEWLFWRLLIANFLENLADSDTPFYFFNEINYITRYGNTLSHWINYFLSVDFSRSILSERTCSKWSFFARLLRLALASYETFQNHGKKVLSYLNSKLDGEDALRARHLLAERYEHGYGVKQDAILALRYYLEVEERSFSGEINNETYSFFVTPIIENISEDTMITMWSKTSAEKSINICIWKPAENPTSIKLAREYRIDNSVATYHFLIDGQRYSKLTQQFFIQKNIEIKQKLLNLKKHLKIKETDVKIIRALYSQDKEIEEKTVYFSLGTMYENSIKNLDKAVEYYKKAEKCGHPDASKKLDQLLLPEVIVTKNSSWSEAMVYVFGLGMFAVKPSVGLALFLTTASFLRNKGNALENIGFFQKMGAATERYESKKHIRNN